MTRDDLIAFVGRDWAAVERIKTQHWIRQKRLMSVGDLFELSATLRRHAQSLSPSWPSPAERHADIQMHQRVGQALRAVARASR